MTKGTLIRTLCLALAIINGLLYLAGKSPLPIDDVMIEEVVTYGFLVVSALAAWWKNNSFTKKAQKADDYLKELKKGVE